MNNGKYCRKPFFDFVEQTMKLNGEHLYAIYARENQYHSPDGSNVVKLYRRGLISRFLRNHDVIRDADKLIVHGIFIP
jgi:hypothetical protein